MRLRVLHGLMATFLLLNAAALVAAQSDKKPLSLALTLEPATKLDGEQIRAQLERELSVVVVTTEVPAEITAETLRIEAPALQTVRVAFRDSERTVDLSTTGPHAVETLALVAANLMRDEASDLLATLRATEPATPPPAPPPPAPEPKTEKPERGGCDPNRYPEQTLAFDLVPYVGTSTMYGIEVEKAFAFSLIGGSGGALRGVEIAGVFNHQAHAVCGGQIAGGVNLVNGPLRGFQLAPINMVDGRVEGGQLGLLNTSSGTLRGFQVAFVNLALRGGHAAQVGFANLVTDYLRGAQVGFGNVATGTVEGSQIGFGNLTLESVDGAQIGFANVSHGRLTGAQVGFANVTNGDSDGVQIGFVNTARQSRGLMLGFVNIAENADAAIGLVNVHTKGRIHLDVWLTDAGLLMVGGQHGGRLFHNIFGIGMTTRNGNGVFAFTYGLGIRAHEGDAMFVNVDAVGYGLITQGESQDNADFASILQLRVPLGFELSQDISLVVSPALNVSVARSADNTLRDPSFWGARMTTAGAPVTSLIWPGATVGVRFF